MSFRWFHGRCLHQTVKCYTAVPNVTILKEDDDAGMHRKNEEGEEGNNRLSVALVDGSRPDLAQKNMTQKRAKS